MQSAAMIYGNITLTCGVPWLFEHSTRMQTGGLIRRWGLARQIRSKGREAEGLGVLTRVLSKC